MPTPFRKTLPLLALAMAAPLSLSTPAFAQPAPSVTVSQPVPVPYTPLTLPTILPLYFSVLSSPC
ncbi:hypothetical protein BKE38_25500 [Pseudoroseomonas deserti]|uniref:Uncharacterized protein n=1 Tax=Teichococcus deserti TaxID=1817963 RepID=A0A1V2GXK2_9PROT|nr:hypothetical protein BKE38_25500 [Pseudoroseomonas deserti]